MDNNTIYFYGRNQNEWRFLSNFYVSPFNVNGRVYTTAEHYYQAHKFISKESQLKIITCAWPSEAKKLGLTLTDLKPNWLQIRDSIMLQALLFKFTENENLREKLINTYPCKLVEESPYDSYWGIGKNKKGLNRLGQLLETTRDILMYSQMLKERK